MWEGVFDSHAALFVTDVPPTVHFDSLLKTDGTYLVQTDGASSIVNTGEAFGVLLTDGVSYLLMIDD